MPLLIEHGIITGGQQVPATHEDDVTSLQSEVSQSELHPRIKQLLHQELSNFDKSIRNSFGGIISRMARQLIEDSYGLDLEERPAYIHEAITNLFNNILYDIYSALDHSMLHPRPNLVNQLNLQRIDTSLQEELSNIIGHLTEGLVENIQGGVSSLPRQIADQDVLENYQAFDNYLKQHLMPTRQRLTNRLQKVLVPPQE